MGQTVYPDMAKNGSMLLQIDVDYENGGMTLNEDFLFDLEKSPMDQFSGSQISLEATDRHLDLFKLVLAALICGNMSNYMNI